jgi:hypothetical protein
MTDTERREYETVIQQLMSEVQRLQSVVAKLTGTDDAHSTLRRLYLDEALPPTARVRAAQAALNVEKPRLAPVEAPLDLVAEPYEPLADVLARQRARADRMLAEAHDIEVAPSGVVRVLPKPSGNGSDD